MRYFVGCFAVLFPRVVLFVLFLSGDYIGRAYEGFIWPFLGFLFMPVTTLAYAWAQNEHGGLNGVFTWVVFIIAILIDLKQAPSGKTCLRIAATREGG